ncbi:MAG: hypothetical protein FWD75_10655 [Propionibacteriaceae bacterium]|nr:hypothetical protein [Propionibacteriaceae bacterium]
MTDYASKIISVDQALDLVEDGDLITVGLGANEPPLFLSNLHRISDRVSNVTVSDCLATVPGEYLSEEMVRKSFVIESWFSTPLLRKLNHTGRVSYIPNNLHFAGTKRNFHRPSTMMVSLASTPGPDGLMRFACGNTYEERIGSQAKYRILEVSPNAPWCPGQNYLDPDSIDFIIESDATPGTIDSVAPNEKDMVIGRIIADLIDDGDCVQVGIGGIPNAVCQYLYEKKDLGVHTEMMTTGIMDLIKAGVITGARKQVDTGLTVFAFVLGSPELYTFVHENTDLFTGRGEEVNDPYVIARNDNQVSINTTVEIDLTGQCCSESIGTLQISGSGGQADTAIGAQNSKNGRSIIALYSTVEKKNKETGEMEVTSKIVPTLRPGAGVTLSRNDVDWVVTEYGAVQLRGTTVRERAVLLASIAHPAFRDDLLAAARDFGYIL